MKPLAHQRVPEPVAGLGRSRPPRPTAPSRAGRRSASSSTPESAISSSVVNTEPSRAARWNVSVVAGRQWREQHGTALDRVAGQLERGERQPAAELADLLDLTRPRGRGTGRRAVGAVAASSSGPSSMRVPAPRRTRLSATCCAVSLTRGRWATAMTTGSVTRAARQVVQQPQRRLVGVLEVVDDEQQRRGRSPPAASARRRPRTGAGGWTRRSSSRRGRTAPARSRAGSGRRDRRAARGACGTAHRTPRAPGA